MTDNQWALQWLHQEQERLLQESKEQLSPSEALELQSQLLEELNGCILCGNGHLTLENGLVKCDQCPLCLQVCFVVSHAFFSISRLYQNVLYGWMCSWTHMKLSVWKRSKSLLTLIINLWFSFAHCADCCRRVLDHFRVAVL